jgi:hypothetical protein
MGSLGLGKLESKGYEAYIEGRVLELGLEAGRKELEDQWKELRRGWYVGGESFLEKLTENLEKAAQGRRKESHSGGAKRAHDENAAERSLEQGLRELGLSRQELETMAKGAPEKVVLAWWLRDRTTVSLRWVSERLGMGHYTRASQAISQMKRPGKKLIQMRNKLLKMKETDE